MPKSFLSLPSILQSSPTATTDTSSSTSATSLKQKQKQELKQELKEKQSQEQTRPHSHRRRRQRRKPRLFNKMLPMFPYLPTYTGPHNVGTIDLEVPIAELESAAPLPENYDIPTVKARIFYPCETTSRKSKPVYWIPDPQWQYLEAFASFLGASSRLSKAFAYSSWFLRSTTIPATRNAPLQKATTSDGKWPVMVFSHGLGGSRNTYSQICGSIASHGMIVIAPEHRDGSCPRTFICDETGTSSRFIDYDSISHTPSPSTLSKRSAQLRIRLAELGLIYNLLLKIDQGDSIPNYSKAEDDGYGSDLLQSMKSQLQVLEPGKISWAGHSFGAASVTQFIKSVYWGAPPKVDLTSFNPLYNPPREHKLVAQITPRSPLILLDPWAFPFHDSQTSWLSDQELPCYSTKNSNGSTVLAVLSEGFFKWRANLIAVKKVIGTKQTDIQEPAHIFYAKTSAHLSQSDFGVLFPWLTRIVLKAQDPDRILRLNTRATMEVVRRAGIEVSRTSDIDMERITSKDTDTEKSEYDASGDADILSTDTDKVRGWIALDLTEETQPGEASNIESSPDASPTDIGLEQDIRA